MGRPIIRIQDLTRSRTKPNYFEGEAEERHVVRKGDLLVSWSATLGAFLWNGPEAVLNQHIFKVYSKIDEDFHFYLICRLIDEMYLQTHGSGMVHITKGKFEAMPIALPPLPEQKRIVAKIEELFTKLDAGVEALRKVKVELKRYRQAVLKHAFEGKLTAAEFENGLPIGWRRMSLKEVTLEKDGLRRGPFGSAIKKAFFVPEGYKVYEQGKAINDDPYRARYYISEEKYDELKNFRVIAGDLLVSCSGVTLGRIVQIPSDAEPGVINQALLRIRLKANLLDSKYFIYLFRSDVFQKMIFARSRGTAMPNLVGIKEFRLIPVNVPPNPEQLTIVSEIERHFSIADEVEQTVEKGLKQAERLRQSILKRAFEGKLVPQDPADEPAERLLERIRAEKEKQKGKKSIK